MKKILFFMPHLFLGGAEKQFRILIDNLPDDYKITVYTLSDFDRENKFITKNDQVEFFRIGLKKRKKSNNLFKKNIYYIITYLIVYFKLFFQFVKGKKYDIIISYRMTLTPLIPIFKILSNKLIFSVRISSKKLYKRKYLKHLYNMCDEITCNSPVTKNILDNIGVNNVKVILNAINIKEEKDQKPPSKCNKLLVVARIHPFKNQLITLKALQKLNNKSIVFAGEIVDDNYYNKLKEFIKKNNLKDRVEFIGYVDNIKSYYDKTDIVILPSKEEGLANVILESFMYKKYCIASNIPENKFILENRGGLFSLDSEKELISEIRRYEDLCYEKKVAIINQNYQYLKENFSLKKYIKEYLSIL